MRLSVDDQGGCAVLRLAGELDSLTSPALREEVERLLASGVRRAVLDLAQLSFVNSAGVRAILASSGRFEAHGGRLAICCPGAACRKVFGAIGLERAVRSFDSEAKAIASLQ